MRADECFERTEVGKRVKLEDAEEELDSDAWVPLGLEALLEKGGIVTVGNLAKSQAGDVLGPRVRGLHERSTEDLRVACLKEWVHLVDDSQAEERARIRIGQSALAKDGEKLPRTAVAVFRRGNRSTGCNFGHHGNHHLTVQATELEQKTDSFTPVPLTFIRVHDIERLLRRVGR